MRVRAAAGLHGADLDGSCQVADVEDPDAAEAFGARILGNPLEAAVDPPARFFHRHDEQVADDRHVALAARADDGTQQVGYAVLPQPVHIEAVITPGHENVAGKCHIRIGKTEQWGTPGFVGFFFRLLAGVVLRLVVLRRSGGHLQLCRRPFGRVLGIEEPGWPRQGRHEFQVGNGLAGVVQSRCQVGARIQ